MDCFQVKVIFMCLSSSFPYCHLRVHDRLRINPTSQGESVVEV